MSKKITVYVFREHSARIQSLSVSSNRIVCLLCLLAAGLAVMAAYVIVYGNLRKSHGTAFNMRHKLTLQLEEISRQRRQIQFFASEINKLKSSILAFDQFERKIRIISNIEATPESSSLFGIGGPIPADMEVNVPVDESHDELLREMHTQLKQVDEATMAQRQGFMALWTIWKTNAVCCPRPHPYGPPMGGYLPDSDTATRPLPACVNFTKESILPL